MDVIPKGFTNRDRYNSETANARAVLAKVVAQMEGDGKRQEGARLTLTGKNGYPGMDEMPYFARVLGGRIELYSLDHIHAPMPIAVYGEGELKLRLGAEVTYDGAGHPSDQFCPLRSAHRSATCQCFGADYTPHGPELVETIDSDSDEGEQPKPSVPESADVIMFLRDAIDEFSDSAEDGEHESIEQFVDPPEVVSNAPVPSTRPNVELMQQPSGEGIRNATSSNEQRRDGAVGGLPASASRVAVPSTATVSGKINSTPVDAPPAPRSAVYQPMLDIPQAKSNGASGSIQSMGNALADQPNPKAAGPIAEASVPAAAPPKTTGYGIVHLPPLNAPPPPRPAIANENTAGPMSEASLHAVAPPKIADYGIVHLPPVNAPPPPKPAIYHRMRDAPGAERIGSSERAQSMVSEADQPKAAAACGEVDTILARRLQLPGVQTSSKNFERHRTRLKRGLELLQHEPRSAEIADVSMVAVVARMTATVEGDAGCNRRAWSITKKRLVTAALCVYRKRLSDISPREKV